MFTGPILLTDYHRLPPITTAGSRMGHAELSKNPKKIGRSPAKGDPLERARRLGQRCGGGADRGVAGRWCGGRGVLVELRAGGGGAVLPRTDKRRAAACPPDPNCSRFGATSRAPARRTRSGTSSATRRTTRAPFAVARLMHH